MQVEKTENISNNLVEVTNSNDILVGTIKYSAEVALSLMISSFGAATKN